jgi:hypothetical protein
MNNPKPATDGDWQNYKRLLADADCLLVRLPEGQVRIVGNARGFNAARNFLGFKQEFEGTEGWQSVDCRYSPTPDAKALSNWARAIEDGEDGSSHVLGFRGPGASDGNVRVRAFVAFRAPLVRLWDSLRIFLRGEREGGASSPFAPGR